MIVLGEGGVDFCEVLANQVWRFRAHGGRSIGARLL